MISSECNEEKNKTMEQLECQRLELEHYFLPELAANGVLRITVVVWSRLRERVTTLAGAFRMRCNMESSISGL